MSDLISLRADSAQSHFPGEPLFWKTFLNQSDLFAYHSAYNGKAGPFSAQLWLFHPQKNQSILVGTKENFENSNAVLSKGLASAHAEAENLSPEKRHDIYKFLNTNKGKGWNIIQVSSGESCPSCRSKQIIFANELIQNKLINKNDFYVFFKSSYEQAQIVSGFNDAPYDQTFRAISKLGILDKPGNLMNLKSTFQSNPVTKDLIEKNKLIYNPVESIEKKDAPKNVIKLFEQIKKRPFAVIINKNGDILSEGEDQRNIEKDGINYPEQTAIINALKNASKKLKQNKTDSWDLEKAILFTNIYTLGPMAYSESFWYNLSKIKIIIDYKSNEIDSLAQEVPSLSNTTLFKQVAADYHDPNCPISVVWNSNSKQTNVSYLLWKAKIEMEGLKQQQAFNLRELEKKGYHSTQFINQTTCPLSDIILSGNENSHYDRKD